MMHMQELEASWLNVRNLFLKYELWGNPVSLKEKVLQQIVTTQKKEKECLSYALNIIEKILNENI